MKTTDDYIEQSYRICSKLNDLYFQKFGLSRLTKEGEKDLEIIQNRLDRIWEIHCKLKQFISKETALLSLNMGHKVYHYTFSPAVFLYKKDGLIYMNKFGYISLISFDRDFKDPLYDTYWMIK